MNFIYLKKHHFLDATHPMTNWITLVFYLLVLLNQNLKKYLSIFFFIEIICQVDMCVAQLRIHYGTQFCVTYFFLGFSSFD